MVTTLKRRLSVGMMSASPFSSVIGSDSITALYRPDGVGWWTTGGYEGGKDIQCKALNSQVSTF